MISSNLKKFEIALNRAAKEVKQIDKTQVIKVISNLDADGISAASIIIKTLERLNLAYSVTILHQLKEDNGREIAQEDYQYCVFCDLGSGQLRVLNKEFKGKKVFVLDHHEVQGSPEEHVTHINPHDYGFDGSSEISASGVCFLFSREVDKENEDLGHIAIIGAIGDVQAKDGFKGLNKIILDIAVRKGKIRVEKGLRLFGLQTRPLHKLLEYSSDLTIPGVTGSESGAVQFLQSIGVEPVNNKNRWRTFADLSKEEKKRLVAGIIMKRQSRGIANAEDVFSEVYVLPDEKPGHFRDAKEFSTLLNSCGRMDNSSLGIGACLGDEKQRIKAVNSLLDYRKEIVSSMNWYNKHASKGKSDRIIKGSNYIIINAKDNVLSTMIGTIASMISKNNQMEDNIYIMSMARNPDDTTKISLRITGNPEGVDLKGVVAELVTRVGGEAGGHQYAAGAIIETDKEDKFIEEAKILFENTNLNS